MKIKKQNEDGGEIGQERGKDEEANFFQQQETRGL